VFVHPLSSVILIVGIYTNLNINAYLRCNRFAATGYIYDDKRDENKWRFSCSG